MPEHFPWGNWALGYDHDIARMVKAEQLGYEEFWIGKHHSGDCDPIITGLTNLFGPAQLS